MFQSFACNAYIAIQNINRNILNLLKEENVQILNSKLFFIQKLLTQNQILKEQYANYIPIVSKLVRQHSDLNIWPRLFTRLNESLMETSFICKGVGLFTGQMFADEKILIRTFENLFNQNVFNLQKFHKKLFYLPFQSELINQLRCSQNYIRKSQLFRKSKINVSSRPQHIKHNLRFLNTIRQFQKNYDIIRERQNIVDTLEKSGFSFFKNLTSNIDHIMNDMFERNNHIHQSINKYSQDYHNRKPQKKNSSKNLNKNFIEKIRSIKNQKRQSQKITFVEQKKQQPSKKYSILNHLDIDIQQVISDTKQFLLDMQQNSNSELSKSSDINMAKNLKKKSIKTLESEYQLKSVFPNNRLKINLKQLTNKMQPKNNCKYVKKMQSKPCILNSFLDSKLITLSDERMLKTKLKKIRQRIPFQNIQKVNQNVAVPIFIMVKNSINIHSFSYQSFRKNSPFLSFQQFVKQSS